MPCSDLFILTTKSAVEAPRMCARSFSETPLKFAPEIIVLLVPANLVAVTTAEVTQQMASVVYRIGTWNAADHGEIVALSTDSPCIPIL
jgi:hypothetical protein